jgi:hypothetical protein
MAKKTRAPNKSGIARKPPPGRKPGASARSADLSSREREFVTLVLDLGVGQAEAMLARLRTRIDAALR